MPRKKSLPRWELGVCKRLVEFRHSRGLSRASVARSIGVNRFTLASIERAQAPLSFVHGYNLCAVYNVSIQWLAVGRLPLHPFTPVAKEILASIGPRWSFFQSHDQALADIVADRLKEIAKENGVPVEQLDSVGLILDRRRSGVSVEDSHLEQVMEMISERGRELSGAKKLEFANALSSVGFRFWDLTCEVGQKNNLSLKASSGNQESDMKPQLPPLRERLAKHTVLRGKKSELAAFIERVSGKSAPLPSVSRWLSGEVEPGGEVALLMLKWVELQERKT